MIPIRGSSILHRSLRRVRSEVNYLRWRRKILKFISLKPDAISCGNVLLSYILEPFVLKAGQSLPNTHTNYWESLQMARTFLDLGYAVDVISYQNDLFMPKKEYSFLIDTHSGGCNLERLSPVLKRDCKKIIHLDTAHILFHNAAECARLLALQQRRGVTLRPRRFMMPNLGIEYADCATLLGNDFTVGTYSYAKKPIYRLPISTPATYPWPENKDFEACRREFLWFGSGGMVHKGLDLVLEAFAEMPAYRLTICGPVNKEEDFVQAFYKELYQTPNIRTVGWVDIESPRFKNILNNAIALIYPSCSEGQSGSVVSCLHGGLIPIISYQCGVDVSDDFGLMLTQCSLEEIKDSVRRIADLPAAELKSMARKAWEFARANHTREKFAEEYKKFAKTLIST
jgi:glycosyltransferase involved in cell wall biosynthesis